jgi:hypothetical protein
MPTISNRVLAFAIAALPAAAAGQAPIPDACPVHLETIAPKLRQSGYAVSWEYEARAPRFLRAAHVEAAGRIDIEYRCGADGLGVAVINHGLPTIPFHVLLAAGPAAKHSRAMPEWLRKRQEAVRP